MRTMRLLPAVAMMLWPLAAWACGACFDANVLRHGWMLNALAISSFPLFFCVLALGVLRCFSGGSVSGVFGNVVAVVVVTIAVSLFAMGSGVMLGLTLDVGLVVTLLRWGFTARKHQRAMWAGIALAFAIAGGRFVAQRPSLQSTERLVSLSIDSLRGAPGHFDENWKLQPVTWIEKELLTRKDVQTALAQEVATEASSPVLVRLDALVRGATVQPQLCAAWKTAQPKLYHANCLDLEKR